MNNKECFHFYFLAIPPYTTMTHAVFSLAGLLILKTHKFSSFSFVHRPKIHKAVIKLYEKENKGKCLMTYKKYQKIVTNDKKIWYDEAINFIRLEKLKRISKH